jgi:hypothetical protein
MKMFKRKKNRRRSFWYARWGQMEIRVRHLLDPQTCPEFAEVMPIVKRCQSGDQIVLRLSLKDAECLLELVEMMSKLQGAINESVAARWLLKKALATLGDSHV